MTLSDAIASAILSVDLGTASQDGAAADSGPDTESALVTGHRHHTAPTHQDSPGAMPAPHSASAIALMRRCVAAEEITRELTIRSVQAARASGLSWADIGGSLGMSRQAAQQRFGGTPVPVTADQRLLGPVTVFDELPELEIAGQLGWHTIGAEMLRHRMVRTETQWQHKRLAWTQSRRALLADGWRIGCKAFPWVYLIRDTGLPALSED